MRTYCIIDATEIPSIDWDSICQNNEDTLRRSLDGSQAVVKFPEHNPTPAWLDGKTLYTHAEILPIMRGPEWHQVITEDPATWPDE